MKTWAKYFGQSSCTLGQVPWAKMAKNLPHLCHHSQETQHQKKNTIGSCSTVFFSVDWNLTRNWFFLATSSVPSKPKQTGTFDTFFGRQPTTILKIGTCKFGCNFFHCRKFHKTSFLYILKDVRDIFAWFKSFSGHSKDIQQWAVKKVQMHFINSLPASL